MAAWSLGLVALKLRLEPSSFYLRLLRRRSRPRMTRFGAKLLAQGMKVCYGATLRCSAARIYILAGERLTRWKATTEMVGSRCLHDARPSHPLEANPDLPYFKSPPITLLIHHLRQNLDPP